MGEYIMSLSYKELLKQGFSDAQIKTLGINGVDVKDDRYSSELEKKVYDCLGVSVNNKVSAIKAEMSVNDNYFGGNGNSRIF